MWCRPVHPSVEEGAESLRGAVVESRSRTLGARSGCLALGHLSPSQIHAKEAGSLRRQSLADNFPSGMREPSSCAPDHWRSVSEAQWCPLVVLLFTRTSVH